MHLGLFAMLSRCKKHSINASTGQRHKLQLTVIKSLRLPPGHEWRPLSTASASAPTSCLQTAHVGVYVDGVIVLDTHHFRGKQCRRDENAPKVNMGLDREVGMCRPPPAHGKDPAQSGEQAGQGDIMSLQQQRGARVEGRPNSSGQW